MARRPKIAIIHHWLTFYGGGEKVLIELHRMYPEAPIYTSAYHPEKFPELKDADVRTTFLNKIPWVRRHHQLFPIFLGTPFKTFDLSEYDLVISSDAAEAKYVRTNPNQLHICYCHTPVRYYWSDYEWRLHNLPFGKLNFLARIVYPLLVGLLRRIDYAGAQGVDVYIANSRYIQERIKKYYHRDSTVIYPPVAVDQLEAYPRSPGDHYTMGGRQVFSKRLDVAVAAFNKLGLPLKVVGIGEAVDQQKPLAKPNIEFLGRAPDEIRDPLLASAKGFVFVAEEDFGIVPVEALAVGTPVIAYNKGGVTEYVIDGVTGVLFDEQTPESLIAAIKRFETMHFDEATLRAKAREFDEASFRRNITGFVDAEWAKFEAKRQD